MTEKQGEASCPDCGETYELVDGEPRCDCK
jgi:uncharacterized Zn-finger protein